MTSTANAPADAPDGQVVAHRASPATPRLFAALQRNRQRIVVAAILVTFSTALAVVVWPGRMSADTLAQIDQVRNGEFNDWHAALLLVLWRPFWRLGFGPGWVTWSAIVTFTFGLYGILRLRLMRPAAVIVTMVIALLPQVVAWVIYLGRDMWFTALFLVSCAALVRVARPDRYDGTAATVLFLAATWLALAARQNALPACGILVIAFVALRRRERLTAGTRRAVTHAATILGIAAAVLLAIVASQWVARRAFDVESKNIEQSIYIYDLAAISHEERRILLDPEFFPAQDLAVLDSHFDPSSFEPLVFGADAVVPYPLGEDAVEELRRDWIDAVLTYPDSYVEGRLTVWFEQLAITEPSAWIVHPGVDYNDWGYIAVNPSLDSSLQRYVRFFASNDQLAGGVVHRVWLYVLVLIAGLWHLRSVSGERRALGWMCLACLAYQGSLLFGLMGAGYRLNLPCVVIALAVAAVAIADILAATRRSGSPTHREVEPDIEPPGAVGELRYEVGVSSAVSPRRTG